MKPYKYTIKNGKTTFHYKWKELLEFYRLGYKHGDVGGILAYREGVFFTYKMFGTIENPAKHITTWTVAHSPLFEGPMPTDEQIVNPVAKEDTDTRIRYSMMVIDFGMHGKD